MDLNLIKRLIRIVEKSEIAEFSIQEGDLKVKISKNGRSVISVPQQQGSTEFINVQNPSNVQNVTPTESITEVKEEIKENLHEVRSPIVGTFYRAPAPDADPYVQIGDQISEGTVLCIVEAMKLMNEIESDVSGKVVKILVENATPVEYNQPLFLIEKD